MSNIICYNDEWIMDNWLLYRSWKALCDAYNKHFNTSIKYNTFKSHCNREMQLDFHYTDEQTEWLLTNYPKLGRVKCAREFNKLFNETRTPSGIRKYCERQGVRVSEERKKELPIENTGRYHEPNSIVDKDGYLFIKHENGKWEQLQKHIYRTQIDDIPEGYIVIFKDGNNRNFDLQNLVAIPRRHAAKMTKNKFWSSCPEITETGLIWCELDECLRVSEAKRREIKYEF